MPVFINEVIVRANVDSSAPSAPAATPGPGPAVSREELVAEVTRRVIEYLERELDRIGER